MKWQKKLTRKELKHIRETTQEATLTEFKRNLDGQHETQFPCFDCIRIARKLGIERKATHENV